jgi:hypothetical protein
MFCSKKRKIKNVSYSLNFELETLPNSLNRSLRSHYFVRSKENHFLKNLVAVKTHGLKPHKPLTKAKLTIVRCYYRSLDFDGLVGSLKPLVDALTHNRIIEDDSWKVLGAWEVTQEFRPKKLGPLLKVTVQGPCLLSGNTGELKL